MTSFFILFQCPGADSNCHALASATPSRWCVYQFRHLGIALAKVMLFRTFEKEIWAFILLFL